MEEQLKLENQLCFSIYTSSRLITRMYGKYLDKLDLTYLQYIVMMVLWENEIISVKTLGEKLYLDSGTLSPLLKKLENKKLISKKRNDNDERIVEVIISEKGKNLKNLAADIPENLFRDTGFSAEEYFKVKEITDNFIKKHL